MQMPTITNGMKVSEKYGKPRSSCEPLVTGANASSWTSARMISAKPSVAMAR